jgi:hypothetical protein
MADYLKYRKAEIFPFMVMNVTPTYSYVPETFFSINHGVNSTLKMKAARSSEKFVPKQNTTQCNNAENEFKPLSLFHLRKKLCYEISTTLYAM